MVFRLAICLIATCAVACESDSRGNGSDLATDGGSSSDGAGSGGDGSTADSGAGLDADSLDAGANDPDGAEPDLCPDVPVMPATTTPCSEEARTCTEACMSGDCVFDCLTSDSPACAMCANQNFVACGNRNGCQDKWDCSTQCTRQMCPDFDSDCITEMCGELEDAFVNCVVALGGRCDERILDCLPPM